MLAKSHWQTIDIAWILGYKGDVPWVVEAQDKGKAAHNWPSPRGHR